MGLDGFEETGLDSFICKNCDARLQKLKSELQSYVASMHCKLSSETTLEVV